MASILRAPAAILKIRAGFSPIKESDFFRESTRKKGNFKQLAYLNVIGEMFDL